MSSTRKDPYLHQHYILFWSWEVTPINPISLACFSQWFPALFTDPTHPNLFFKTTEHHMMFSKAILFDDQEIAKQIIDAETPEEAKALGRKVKGFDRVRWNKVADEVVERGNYHKFNQDERLKAILLKTKGKTLVEASPDDRIWGIGFGVDEAEGKEDQWGANR
ncbi:hypothetical protein CI109_103560 [Kwoniella shandongensis]|uniref:Uncharacterized protein n=1 Tax=Kwoniella shandongensis TaxID=1734106 RepID=A0A5M6BWD7_9TREE|nr:uncharacterized protein CI109_004538 [Kwoniella shandongensis]KAA5527003.1 hypothetical protein CI109_004538 [Kwoniella shandongensis]